MVMNGLNNDTSIAEAFVQRRSYKELFTSVPYNKSDMQRIVPYYESVRYYRLTGINVVNIFAKCTPTSVSSHT